MSNSKKPKFSLDIIRSNSFGEERFYLRIYKDDTTSATWLPISKSDAEMLSDAEGRKLNIIDVEKQRLELAKKRSEHHLNKTQ